MQAKWVDPSFLPSFTGRFLGPLLNPGCQKLTSTVVSVSGIQQAVCYDFTFKPWGLGFQPAGSKFKPLFPGVESLCLSLTLL